MEEDKVQPEDAISSETIDNAIIEELYTPKHLLLDISHPAFKSAFFVLCDQVCTHSVWAFISSIFFPFRLAVARWMLDSVFQPRLHLPVMATFLVTAFGLWDLASGEYNYESDFDLANSIRIGRDVRNITIFVATSISYISGIAFFNRHAELCWGLLKRAKSFLSISYMCTVVIIALSSMVVLSWRDLASSIIKRGHQLLTRLFRLPTFLLRISALPLGSLFAATEQCGGRLRTRLSRRVLKTGFSEVGNYTYKSVDVGKAEFRVLKIRGSVFSTHCSLINVSPLVGNIPTYETISWRWDGPGGLCALVVDGQHLVVSKTVSDILRALQPLWGSRYLWIDSICINQADIAEKATQIPLMSLIYRGASRTIAYLGDTQDAGLVPEFITRLDVIALQRLDPGYFRDTNPLHRFPFPEEHRNWKAYQDLLRHPFWSRVWIIQEIILSKSLTFLYGGRYIDWDMLARVTLSFTLMSSASGISFLSMENMFGGDRLSCLHGRMNVSWLALTRAAYSKDDMVSLPQVLQEVRGSDATDNRDRIYALQSLDAQYQVPELKPDYTISAQQLYTRVARHVLSSGSFSLFGLAGLGHARAMELPSWVPDLTVKPLMKSMHDMTCKYSVTGETSVMLDLTQGRDDTVTLKGCLLDRISDIDRNSYWTTILSSPESIREEMVSGISFDQAGTDLRLGLCRWLRAIVKMVKNRSPSLQVYPFTEEPCLEAILRTMIGDRDQTSFPASRKVVEFLANYIHSLAPDLTAAEGGIRRPLTSEDNLSALNVGKIWVDIAAGRQFALTASGYMALVPDRACIGDFICVLIGAKVPYVLRDLCGDHRGWQLVGEAYVHGIMGGVSPLDLRNTEWLTLH